MSLTGANADKRVPASPAQQAAALAYITGAKALADVPETLRTAAEQAKKQLEKREIAGFWFAACHAQKHRKKYWTTTHLSDR